MRYASTAPSTRFDVIKLQEEMDAKLMKRQARDSGICPVREDIYMQCFGKKHEHQQIWRELIVINAR
jgi:dynein light intermediate chain